jgi:hypothetical protein
LSHVFFGFLYWLVDGVKGTHPHVLTHVEWNWIMLHQICVFFVVSQTGTRRKGLWRSHHSSLSKVGG